jgi:hypothetical protein
MRPLTTHQAQCDRRFSTSTVPTDRDVDSMVVVHSAGSGQAQRSVAKWCNRKWLSPSRRPSLRSYLTTTRSHGPSRTAAARPSTLYRHTDVTERQQWTCSVAQCMFPGQRGQSHGRSQLETPVDDQTEGSVRVEIPARYR